MACHLPRFRPIRPSSGAKPRFRRHEAMDATVTKSERETLKAIYRLTRDKAEAQTGALAEHLGVAPGTATMTVKKLAERGLVDHRPYHGVELTDSGRRLAVAFIRRHRKIARASCRERV